jgi:Fic family protein
VPPPPGDQLKLGFEQWLEWVDSQPELPPVVRAALAHYQFETLHPYSDGNGRIGRLAIVLELMRDGVLRQPILVVSPWFEGRRRQYQDGLLELSRSGHWDPWVRFFASGVTAAADDTRQRIEELLAWRYHALGVVRAAGVSGIAERLAGELIGAPVLTAARVARSHGVSHQGAMNALRRLAGIGLLEEGRRPGRRTFRATPVVEILSQ